jgi:hypothetical protein
LCYSADLAISNLRGSCTSIRDLQKGPGALLL